MATQQYIEDINLIEFTIPGEPVGKGRPRFTRGGMVYTPRATLDYEKKARETCKTAIGDFKGWRNKEPLNVTIMVNYGIPKSYSKKQRILCEKQILLPTKKPDIDNIAKIILDALQPVLYNDDTQVIQLHMFKQYVQSEPCVNVKVEMII